MRLRDYLDISQAPDKTTFRRRMIDVAHSMDFAIVGAILLVEDAGQDPAYKGYIGNRPPDFGASTDPRLANVDPVIARLRRSPLPFVYNQQFYVDAGVPEMWEHAAPYGYRTGISVALTLSNTEQFMFGLDRDRDLPREEEKITRLLADLQMLAVHCQDAVHRFHLAEQGPVETPSLSKRELEVLRWTLEGMTAFEVGQQLNISERTTNQHIQHSMRKLQARDKHQAALKALRLKLIR